MTLTIRAYDSFPPKLGSSCSSLWFLFQWAFQFAGILPLSMGEQISPVIDRARHRLVHFTLRGTVHTFFSKYFDEV